jgi:hypothetical protein
MKLLHGAIDDVHGDMKWHGDTGFVNATVGLSGNGWSVECELREFNDLEHASHIAQFVAEHIDAIWVLGRIKAVFGSWIGLTEGEKSILNEGFAAYLKETDVWIPFVLHDYYLSTSFLFGATLTDSQMKRSIARSFYELLLQDPDNLVDFEFRKDHVGASHYMVGGVAGGQVQYDEEHY